MDNNSTEFTFYPLVSDLMAEEDKGQMGRLWRLFKNNEMLDLMHRMMKFRENITIIEVTLIQYFD